MMYGDRVARELLLCMVVFDDVRRSCDVLCELLLLLMIYGDCVMCCASYFFLMIYAALLQRAGEKRPAGKPMLQMARYVNGHDVVPHLPFEDHGFQHVCEETRLDQFISCTRPATAHELDSYAANLANCFRDQVRAVAVVESAVAFASDMVPLLMFSWFSWSQGLPTAVFNWLTANDFVHRQLETLSGNVIELKHQTGALY